MVGGQIKYIFKLAHDTKGGKAPTFVVHLKIDEWERPSVGTQLKLPVSNKTWEVIRVEPPTNPAGQQNTYFIAEI